MRIFYFFLLFVPLISPGCSKDAVKQSEDSILAHNALQAIERIKHAYETKDPGHLNKILAPDLFSRVNNEPGFDKAALSFSTPRVIKISASYVTISVNWHGLWEIDGMTRKRRGSSSFIFLKDSMLLEQIDGDNPLFVPDGGN